MTRIPTQITLHKISGTLEVEFSAVERFNLPFEYLRVFSPSAEVRGHGVGQEKLVLDKQHVKIIAVEAVGQYGIKPIFDDGHNSGIYTWQTLHDLGVNYAENWQDYLRRVETAKAINKGK